MRSRSAGSACSGGGGGTVRQVSVPESGQQLGFSNRARGVQVQYSEKTFRAGAGESGTGPQGQGREQSTQTTTI